MNAIGRPIGESSELRIRLDQRGVPILLNHRGEYELTPLSEAEAKSSIRKTKAFQNDLALVGSMMGGGYSGTGALP